MVSSKNLSLFIDTASNFCTSAFLQGEEIFDCIIENINKGHAERLAPQIQELCQKHKLELSQIEEIFVNIGPGSFTGMRVGVAFARALGLSLNKPVSGITQLEALAALALNACQPPIEEIMVSYKAYHEYFYVQNFLPSLNARNAPHILSKEDVEKIIQQTPHPLGIIGDDFASFSLLSAPKTLQIIKKTTASLESFAKIIAKHQQQPNKDISAPLPLYLRAAL